MAELSRALILFTLSASLALIVVEVKADSITVSGNGCSGASAQRYSMDASSFLVLAESGSGSNLGKCSIVIRFESPITAASVRTLRDTLDVSVKTLHAPLVIVSLHSDGGDVFEALSVGDHIRRSDYRYVVMGVNTDDRCNSSCVFLLAAGYKRFVSGSVGIHRPYLSPERVREMGYSDLRQAYDAILIRLSHFLNAANIDERLAADMWQIPSHRLKSLSADELASYGLSQNDAVQTEIDNAALRNACGVDAPTYKDDYWRNVIGACTNSEGVLQEGCVNRLGRNHPYCRCNATLNPDMGFVCD